MSPAETYELLRNLTTPVVAITTKRGDKLNGMISDGAIRASIVPDVPRLGVFIHKFNFSHGLVYETGRFVLHVLNQGQVDTVVKLGFESGRDKDKLEGMSHSPSPKHGVPVLADCYCWFECEVINVMDTGSSTFFLADVVTTGKGPGKEPLEPAHLRSQLSPVLLADYKDKLEEAQAIGRKLSKTMKSGYTRRS